MESKPLQKVQVFLSAYNGEKYIQSQVESILQQEAVDVLLTIRDDGSTDRTYIILENLSRQYPKKIQIIKGKNLGYRKSFLSMLEQAEAGVAYFAYADQDDIWEPEKLKCAITLLKRKSQSWLYASALKITDADLNVLSVKSPEKMRQTLGSFFVRTRLAGCTMVFTRALLEIAVKYDQLEVSHEMAPDHDALLCMLSMLYEKDIVLDPRAYILHRRHATTETSGGRGIKNRIQVESKRIFHRPHSYQYTARLLLKEPIDWTKNEQSVGNRSLLEAIAGYDQSIWNEIKLCFNKNICCGVRVADILIRIKMILRCY